MKTINEIRAFTATPEYGKTFWNAMRIKHNAEGTHEAIISTEEYEAVQAEIARMAAKYVPPDRYFTGRYPFFSLSVCAHCGKHYRRKVTATGPVWICSTYNYLGKAACPSKQIPEIVPEEAEIVREIYKLFIQGKTVNWIATHVTAKGISTPRGKAKWQTSTIESILTNEKYKGSAVLQKKFTVDFLSKKMKVNEGEVPQYIVDQSHPAIIDPAQWQKVQDEMAVRKSRGKHHNSISPFSAKIVCGDCGDFYGSKVWHSTDKYRRVIWQCNGKFKGKDRCATPHLYEEDIKRLFLRAVAQLTMDREVLLEICRMIYDEYLNTDAIDAECATLNDEIEIVSGLTRKLIAENATTAIPQDEYNRRYDALVERYHAAQDRLDELQNLRITRSFQADVLECFMFEKKAIDNTLPLEYTDRFWHNLIDWAMVYHDDRMVFRFKNGTEVTETL